MHHISTKKPFKTIISAHLTIECVLPNSDNPSHEQWILTNVGGD